MARQPRKRSKTGIYHVMMRGINKQPIFLDDQDYCKFIKVLTMVKQTSQFELYAYCLMNNHIHLLIKESESDNISNIIKRIGCSFVYWYNLKYERVGHLFQDRFRSEPIENDEYLLCALRYIHQNPVTAGITKTCSEYEFSSYRWYFKPTKLVDKKLIFDLISEEQFRSFHKVQEQNDFIEVQEQKRKLSEQKAEIVFKNLTNCQTSNDFYKLEKTVQKEYIKELKSEGCTIKELCQLSGLTFGQISRM